jgi:alcohol dehydrogenase YqhD (iron-dependent ADH family)
VPLYQSSSYKRICDTQLQTLINWSDKLLKKIDNTYKKAPYFTDTFPVIEKIILYKTDNLADFLANQLIELSKLMNLSTEIVLTSRIYGNQQLSGQERVIDICRQEQTDIYLNAIGGQTLYDSKTFSEAGIKLQFIEMKPVTYSQKSTEFVPYLSIIDVLMNIGVKGVKEHLNAFELKTN